MSKFFVPFVDPANQEEAYHGMAAFVGGAPLPVGRRIHSITFMHNGDVWTATVGEKMKGRLPSKTVDGAGPNERDAICWSADTVIAIYSGSTVPYLIAHDGAGRNRWNMPVWVRAVLDILTFD